MTQYEKAKYGCFNDCFSKKDKKEMRPINMEENAFIAPCDGRLSAYHISENSDFI
ncbi:MAG: phosphatidylserine decarboxylase [Eubacterium sp.]